MATTGKPPLPMKWVECNKADLANPDYRSRMVVRETKRLSTLEREDVLSVFSAVPPLEALRLL
eukprot:8643677-Karenia_brevis.AAC.1